LETKKVQPKQRSFVMGGVDGGGTSMKMVFRAHYVRLSPKTTHLFCIPNVSNDLKNNAKPTKNAKKHEPWFSEKINIVLLN
jgi:hypothetical protein